MKYSVGLSTDPGPRSGVNQDSASVSVPKEKPSSVLLVVADGMGGANAGDYASQQAVSTIKEELLKDNLPHPEFVPHRLQEAITLANQKIFDRSSTSPDMHGMGCTVVVAVVLDDTFWVASVGDSRAYLIRNGSVKQLTEDHTWVNAQVRVGLLTPEQAANHDLSHVLERAVGTDTEVEVDILADDILETDDVLVLCSDGLYNVVEDTSMAALIDGLSAQEAADLLLKSALEAPARDNVTVAVLRVTE